MGHGRGAGFYGVVQVGAGQKVVVDQVTEELGGGGGGGVAAVGQGGRGSRGGGKVLLCVLFLGSQVTQEGAVDGYGQIERGKVGASVEETEGVWVGAAREGSLRRVLAIVLPWEARAS